MKIALIIILAFFAKPVFASDEELPEMTEDCVYEAHGRFVESSGMAVLQFDAVVTDGGVKFIREAVQWLIQNS